MAPTDPNKMTELFGFEVDELTRSLVLDLLLACVVIFFIMAPSFFCPVEGRMLKRKDSWDDIIKENLELEQKRK